MLQHLRADHVGGETTQLGRQRIGNAEVGAVEPRIGDPRPRQVEPREAQIDSRELRSRKPLPCLAQEVALAAPQVEDPQGAWPGGLERREQECAAKSMGRVALSRLVVRPPVALPFLRIRRAWIGEGHHLLVRPGPSGRRRRY